MKYYRLLTTLPLLPDTPRRPPIALAEVIAAFHEELSDHDRALANALLGALDCRNVEAMLAGSDAFDDRAPLSRDRIAERRELPEHLEAFFAARDAAESSDEHPLDRLWQSFYEAVADAGEREHSRFVSAWASFELDLKSQLLPWRVAARTGANGRTRAGGARVSDDVATLLAGLEEAKNPMERERVLDTRRLEEIEALSGHDPFASDAALAYLASMLVLDAWKPGDATELSELLEDFS
jgi:hypothetical protein